MNDWFCPLIGKKCNTSCVCFKKKKIVPKPRLSDGYMKVIDTVIPEHCLHFHGDLSK